MPCCAYGAHESHVVLLESCAWQRGGPPKTIVKTRAAHLMAGSQGVRKRSIQSRPKLADDHGDSPSHTSMSSLPSCCSGWPVSCSHGGTTPASTRSGKCAALGRAPGSAHTEKRRLCASSVVARRRKRPTASVSMFPLK